MQEAARAAGPARRLVNPRRPTHKPSLPAAPKVSCTEPYEWKDPTDTEWEFNNNTSTLAGGKQFTVVAYDFGIKHNILRRLASFGCKIVVVPATYPADKVLAMNPDGVFFSNGPVRGVGAGGWGGFAGAGCRRPGATRAPGWHGSA